MKLLTVTGEEIELGSWASYSLNYVIECGMDWIADVSICHEPGPRKARVFVSQNAGVGHLMSLALDRHALVIKRVP